MLGLTAVSPSLGSWAQAAARQTRAELAAIGAGDLPVTVIHGDFAEWNVHYQRGRPLCHAFRLDMAAWELDHALKTGEYHLAVIQRHLSRTGTPPP